MRAFRFGQAGSARFEPQSPPNQSHFSPLRGRPPYRQPHEYGDWETLGFSLDRLNCMLSLS